MQINTVHNMDVLDGLRQMPDGVVQCVVTSPPYWGLRDYGIEGQIGLEDTLDGFIERMVEVFREVRRVLRDDGTCWVNMGDSYASNPASGGTGPRQGGGEHRQTPTSGYTRPAGLKAKDLCGVPWRLALALQHDGWWLRSDIIWHKPNPMPESVTDRPTKSHEYIFLLTKSAKYFYDADAVRSKTGREANAADYAAADGRVHFHEDDLGQGMSQNNPAYKAMTNPAGRNLRTVWTIPTQPFSEAHFATFPEKLVEPCIKAGTSAQACEHCGAPWERVVETWIDGKARNENGAYARGEHDSMTCGYLSTTAIHGTKRSHALGFRPTCTCENEGTGRCLVLDPFMGSGTVGVVAKQLGRDYTGFELNPEYCEMANRRIQKQAPGKLWDAEE